MLNEFKKIILNYKIKCKQKEIFKKIQKEQKEKLMFGLNKKDFIKYKRKRMFNKIKSIILKDMYSMVDMACVAIIVACIEILVYG